MFLQVYLIFLPNFLNSSNPHFHIHIAAILAEIPDRVNLSKKISRARLRDMPPNPFRLSDLEDLPEQYRLTLGGATFLLYDSFDEEDDERIIVFTTTENIKELFRSEVWFADGTFKTAPSIFFQLFSILGAVSQVGINHKPQTIGMPLVHALLQNKQQSSYDTVFRVIFEEGNRLGLTNLPRTLMSDFELAIINAAQDYFGKENVRCCFFHLCQSVYRRVTSEGLQTAYTINLEIKTAVHSLCALAFVPAESVEEHFLLIRDDLPDELHAVVTYFENTYIRRFTARRRCPNSAGAVLRVQRKNPRYPPILWNQYNAVLQGQARTNNLSESWHNRFQVVVGKHHPSLYSFLDELKKEQADCEIMLRQLQLGQRIRRGPDRRRRQIEDQLYRTVLKYEEYLNNRDISTYLKTVGYNIKM